MVQNFDTGIYCNYPKYLSPVPVRILKIQGFSADVYISIFVYCFVS